jgi:hypothetical protein
MKKVIYLSLLSLITVRVSSQIPVKIWTFSNVSGTATRVLTRLPSNLNKAVVADQAAGLIELVDVTTSTVTKTPIVGLNATTDFALGTHKSPNATADTLVGSFASGGSNYIFAPINIAGTSASIDTRWSISGNNGRAYHSILLLPSGNRQVYFDKNPAFASSPFDCYVNGIQITGHFAELTPSGGVIQTQCEPSILVPPVVPPIPMVNEPFYLLSGDIFYPGSFTTVNGVASGKAFKLSADGTVVTPLSLSNSNQANVYTAGGRIGTNGVTYIAYSSGVLGTPLITFDENTNTFGSVGAPLVYQNPQSAPFEKNGKMYVTGSTPISASTGSTILALDMVTSTWEDNDNGLWINGYAANQTVTQIFFGVTGDCGFIFGNMGQNTGTLASNVSFQAAMCPPVVLAFGMELKFVRKNDFEITLHFTNVDQSTVLQKSTNGVNFIDLPNALGVNSEGNVKVGNITTGDSYFRLRSVNTYSNIVRVASSKDNITVMGLNVYFPNGNTLEVYNTLGQKVAIYKNGNAILTQKGILILASISPNGEREIKKVFIQ